MRGFKSILGVWLLLAIYNGIKPMVILLWPSDSQTDSSRVYAPVQFIFILFIMLLGVERVSRQANGRLSRKQRWFMISLFLTAILVSAIHTISVLFM